MNKKIDTKKSGKTKERWLSARKNFAKIQKEIEPFTKKKEFKEISTAGLWYETSSFLSQH